MARPSKAASSRSTARPGRPSNAVIAQRNETAQRHFIETVTALASATLTSAIHALTDGGVTTIGVPQSGQQAKPASTTSRATSGTAKVKQAPGRRADPNSALSKSREIYANQIGKMPRNDIVNMMVSKLGISKSVANTYYHSINRQTNGKGTSRRPRSSSSNAQATGTNG